MVGSTCYHSGENEQGCVSRVPIFNHPADSQMREIMQVVQNRRFKKNATIYYAEDQVDALSIVHQSQVTIYYLSKFGRE